MRDGVASASVCVLARRKPSFRWRGIGASIAVALGLSGCILGSENPAVDLEVPASYRGGNRSPDAALPGLDWWRGFRSAELTSLIEAAQSANLDIAVAVAQIVQADAQAGIAGAPLLPTVTGVGNTERIRLATTSGSSGSSTRSQVNVGLTASYMIDFWGKNRATLFAAQEDAIAARYNRDVVTLSTTVSVANTYFQILTANDRLRIARGNVAAAERILTLVRQQFNAGTVSQLDLSQQETLVATQKAAVPPLELAAAQSNVTLALLLARASANFTVIGGGMAKVSVPRVTPGLPSELLRRRPDVLQAESQLAASNFSVESARAAFFPQIQLTGDAGFQSKALASLFGPGAWYYTLAAGLTQPIFDGWLLQSQLDQARGAQSQALQAYRQSVLSSFADVEKALVALTQTTRQERLQSEVVSSARRAFEVAEAQLRGGTANLISVLQSQQTLFTAEDNLAQVRLSRFLAATSLFQALGGGWTRDPPL
ncbi:efflux transporter outer membrane subunit [Bosea sp. TAF32]|uniref:efflux transporter outer membrane subunit n=1 Tax=Bosea sp. TAF32 TaxID=3237482 RepID=UPI003F8FCBDA